MAISRRSFVAGTAVATAVTATQVRAVRDLHPTKLALDTDGRIVANDKELQDLFVEPKNEEPLRVAGDTNFYCPNNGCDEKAKETKDTKETTAVPTKPITN